jgi:hypothetical protein
MKKLILLHIFSIVILSACSDNKVEDTPQETQVTIDTTEQKIIGKWHIYASDKYDLSDKSNQSLQEKYEKERQCVINFKEGGKGVMTGPDNSTMPFEWKLEYDNKYIELVVMKETSKMKIIKISPEEIQWQNKSYIEKLEPVK